MEKLLVANYKMNGDKNFYQKVNKIINKLKSKDTVVLCPPFVYMPFLKIRNRNAHLGAQDVCAVENKQSTGQIKASMLKNLGANYCIVGHSERREIGETDEMIASKVEMLQKNEITPIICVGEIEKSNKIDVVINQVKFALSKAIRNEIVFAYEPVWAIGTGVQPTVNQINKVVNQIKTTSKEMGFEVKVLYGGSVNLTNIHEVRKSVSDGFLMGGVSLKLNDFLEIVKGE